MKVQQFTNAALVFISQLARLTPMSWGQCKVKAEQMEANAKALDEAKAAGNTVLDADGNEVTGDTALGFFTKTLIGWSIVIAGIFLFTAVAKAIALAIAATVLTLLVVKALGRLSPNAAAA